MAFSKNHIILFFTISLFSACYLEDINGHWHIQQIARGNDEYNTLDIREDSVILDRYSPINALKGMHDKNGQKIHLPIECGSYGDFSYFIKDENLYLKYLYSDSNEIIYKGYKCENDCCNKVNDTFLGLKVDIHLQKLPDTLKNSALEYPDEKKADIFLGIPKKRFVQFYSDSLRMQVYDRLVNVEILDFWFSELKHKVEKDSFPSLKIVIHISDKLKDGFPNKVISHIKNLGHDEIYLSFKDQENNLKIVHYKLIYL